MIKIVRDNMDNLSVGQNADAFIKRVVQTNEELAIQGEDDAAVESIDENPEPVMDSSTVQRITTGLGPLDMYTAGGLGLGQLGMVTACPGVGKTNSLINFMYAAATVGIRSLFFTLELSGQRIKHRFQAIAAHIPAGTFLRPVYEWNREEQERYNFIVNPEYKYFGFAGISDMSKKTYTIQDIDTRVKQWMEDCDKKYGSADACRVIMIDWLDRLDTSNLASSRNTRDDVLLMKANEKLAELGRRHNLAVWTATQGTREADGSEILKMKHTAHGFHKHDPTDISIGLAEIRTPGNNNQREGVKRFGGGKQFSEPTACRRYLRGSIMKNRDNPIGSFSFYQGPTLRFWESKEAASETDTLVENGTYISTIGYKN
jgi:replicative DNA helicase